MRFAGIIALSLVLTAVASAHAQNTPYVDPALRAVTRPTVQTALRRSTPFGLDLRADQQHVITDVAVRKASIVAEPRVALFAKIRNESAIAELNAAGATIGSRIGDIITVEIPVHKLPDIFASPHFLVLEAARNVFLSNDSSMRVIRADVVRRATGNSWSGTAGAGVLVGVYDTGIDFSHEDFIDANGNTRVLGLWDQSLSPASPPTGFGYGFYCNSAAIQQTIQNPASLSCPSRDIHGHGTHVAGSAAGDGSATGVGGTPFVHAGVAPLADLLIVKGGNGIFAESSIIDGLVWLEAEARRLNRPIVVNLSLGSQAGAHDGSRLYEAAVDNLTRPGFIVVMSVGNDATNGNDKNPDGSEPTRNPRFIHGSGPPGTSRDFTIEIPVYTALQGACNDFANVSVWYEAVDLLSISVLRPDGGIVTAAANEVREQDSPVGNVRIDNGSSGPNPRNNAFEADVRINDCGNSGAAPVNGTWTLRVSFVRSASNKPYHLWMVSQSLGGAALARGRLGFDNHYIVTSPANARNGIGVSAFVTRLCWNSPAKPEGPVCFVTLEPLGDIARFSGAGPTRDGRLKPEVAAPGLGIASARSRHSFPAANRVLRDGVHTILEGTSMAAPQVTGTVALMLQLNPTLTPAGVRDILARTSERDVFTSRVYDNSSDAEPRFWWGHGKLNVCAALGAVGVTGGGEPGPVVITPAADTLPVNATTRFFSCSPTGAAIAFHSTNPEIATVAADGTVRALQRGVARLIATSGTFADTAVIVVTDPANLGVTVRNAAPATTTLSPRGTLLPLLSTVLRANGYEPIRVTQLSYRITGFDPNGRLVIVADANRNGAIDFGERTIAAKIIGLAGAPVQVDMALDSLIVPQRDSVHLIAAIELSGSAPNGATFSAEFIPAGIRTTGMRSLAANRVDPITTPLASSVALTTVLNSTQTFVMSENPVRGDRVVFNFAQTPSAAGVYTLTGRLVANLTKRMIGSGSSAWDLTNDNGDKVASGVYLVVFNFGSGPIREKLMVIRGGGQ